MAGIKVKATIDASGYKRSVKGMQRSNREFGRGLDKTSSMLKKAFAVAGISVLIAKVAQLTGSLIQLGSELTDQAAQVGLTSENLQRLSQVTEMTGASQRDLINTLNKLNSAQAKLVRGDATATKAFEDLGLSIEEVAGMDAEQMFIAVSRSLSKAGMAGEEYAAAIDLIGERSLPKMREAMDAVASQGVDSMTKSLKSLTNENAQQLDAMADGWKKFWQNRKRGAANAIGSMSRRFTQSLFGTDVGAERVAENQEKAAKRAAEREKTLEEAKSKARQVNREKEAVAAAKLQEQALKGTKAIEERATVGGAQAGALQRVGAFTGGATSPELQLARKRLQVAEETARYLASIDRKTETGGLK
jgi:hypothetical protein